MKRTLLKSKLHNGRVTGVHLEYEGSVSVDRRLLELADIMPYEQVDIYDITNGARLTTYAIPDEPGSGTIGINGAAAHLVQAGDRVIIASYAMYEEAEIARHKPKVILLDESNEPRAPSSSGKTHVSQL